MKRPSPLLAAALLTPLVGLTVGVVWCLRSVPEATLVSTAPVTTPAPRPEVDTPQLDLDRSFADVEREQSPDAEASMEAFLDVVRAEMEVPLDEGRPLVVEVRDAESDLPVPGAQVFFLDGYEGPELRDPFAAHWSTLAEERGEPAIADHQGQVTLPSVERWAFICAKGEGTFGAIRLGPLHDDVETIRLQLDETVRVLVVDEDDRPVSGVPVGLLQRLPQQRNTKKLKQQIEKAERSLRQAQELARKDPAKRNEAARNELEARKQLAALDVSLRDIEESPLTTRDDLRARARTSKDGLALFRHFQFYRERTREWWPGEHIDQFQAGLLVPMRDPRTISFAGHPVPDETLTLRLPPTARLSLRTVDRDGRPFVHPVRAELGVDDPDVAGWTRQSLRKKQGASTIEVPFVGLGVVLTAQCRLDDKDFRWQLPPFSGPTTPGEHRVVDLLVAPDEGMLYGILLDDANQPLVGVRPTFLINRDNGRLEGEEIVTGPEGQFHLPYQVRDNTRGPFRFEVRHDDITPPIGTAMPLTSLPRDRVTDLGTLRLAALSALAAGRVVDDRGEPINRATVQLQRERNVGKEARKLGFVDEAFVSVRTDEEGLFELYGSLERGRYRLEVGARNHFALLTEDFSAGESLELMLERESRLLGSVLAPDWMKRESLTAVLQSLDDPDRSRTQDLRERRGRRSISIDDVRSGFYDFSIRSKQFPDPVFEILGMRVDPGQRDTHPRLDELDLRNALFRFQLTALNEQGERFNPNRPLIARILRRGGQVGHVGFDWKNGQIEVIGREPQLEVWPVSSGFGSDPQIVNHGSSELRFYRVPPIEIHVPGMRRAARGTETRIAMSPVGSRGLPERLESWDGDSGRMARKYSGVRWTGANVGRDDRARVSIGQTGPYRVIASVGRRSRGSRPATIELGTIDVEFGSPSYTFSVDPRSVEAALEELERRKQERAGR